MFLDVTVISVPVQEHVPPFGSHQAQLPQLPEMFAGAHTTHAAGDRIYAIAISTTNDGGAGTPAGRPSRHP